MKANVLRLFIAVPIPQGMKESLKVLQASWKAKAQGVRWVKPEGLHITLKFLGNVHEEKLEGIKEAMRKALSGFTPFEVRVKGTGAFPSTKNPRVLWVGVKDEEGKLKGVFNALEKALQKWGFPREDRPFSPHLTLGRVKGKGDFSFLEEGSDLDFGPLLVEEVILFKSDLKPEGAEYTPLYAVPLGGER